MTSLIERLQSRANDDVRSEDRALLREAAATITTLSADLEAAVTARDRLRLTLDSANRNAVAYATDLEAAREALRILPLQGSSLYPEDGSEGDTYRLVLCAPGDRPEVTGVQLAAARALLSPPRV